MKPLDSKLVNMVILMLSRFQNKILVNPVYHKNVFKSDLYTIVILNNILVYNSACHIHNYSSWVMGWLIVMVILLSLDNRATRVCPQWINYTPLQLWMTFWERFANQKIRPRPRELRQFLEVIKSSASPKCEKILNFFPRS